MDYTEQQQQGFKKSFADRKRGQLFALILFVPALVAVVFADETSGLLFGLAPTVWLPIVIVVLIGGFAFSFRNWRCPACNGYLGKALSPKFCAKCGVVLQD